MYKVIKSVDYNSLPEEIRDLLQDPNYQYYLENGDIMDHLDNYDEDGELKELYYEFLNAQGIGPSEKGFIIKL